MTVLGLNPDEPSKATTRGTGGRGATRHNPAEPGKDDLLRSLEIFTLVLWLAFLALGCLGFVLRYERPRAIRIVPAVDAILVEPLRVELKQEAQPLAPTQAAPPSPIAPSAPPVVVIPANIPQPIATTALVPMSRLPAAFPSPSGAAPTLIDPLKTEATERVNAPTTPSATPAPAQPLTFGEGEGKQPAPEYPRLAIRQRQEGATLVRLRVDETGRVGSAEATRSSSWPLLDAAALKVVLERWRFRPGPPRVYEVSIRFQLTP
ncbi:MAG: TonB family protein [Verrucomicrobia bacterium]|nr:TonB family protein [Verrucomicrobiota bacterium]MBI3870090.1 TonB family protein [Verrucomicrobiota bacterium]